MFFASAQKALFVTEYPLIAGGRLCYYRIRKTIPFPTGGKNMSVKILAVGDVCGEPGLSFLNNHLRNIRKEMGIG